MLLSAGDKLGPYEILAPIGAGGMGQVYRAHDSRLNRDVAIKVSDVQFSVRFEREAKAIAALNHSNICQVYDVGPNYLVLELIEGTPLRGPLALDQALRYAVQICDALDAAHRKNITHRDLKPANILVTATGVKLLDFGLAKIAAASVPEDSTRTMAFTEAGAVMGTAPYMSPEQAKGEEVDARSDIFSFGAVLYEMLSGRRAFARNSSVETMSAILRDEPAPLDGPSNILVIVTRCLRKLPVDRFQTMSEVRTALETAAIAKPADKQPSIAVLPFANMSADKENEYFSDGLAEEILNLLAKSPGLKVIARTSSFAFRGKEQDIVKIAETLRVQTVLEGSVRKAGNRVRVTAQLINASDGAHVWSERYDRELTDVFAIQDEISQAITGALKVALSIEREVIREHPAVLGAYEAYLKGRHHLGKNTAESLNRSREFFEEAIALDPNYAEPHAGLGEIYHKLATEGVRASSEVMPKVRAEARKALALNPSNVDAQALLGSVAASYDYDWPEAERIRATLAHSTSSMAVFLGIYCLMPHGRIGEVMELLQRALQQDPMNALLRTILGFMFNWAGMPEEGIAEMRKVLEVDEGHYFAHFCFGEIHADAGRLSEALEAAERAYQLAPWHPRVVGSFAGVLARTGDQSRADDLIHQLQTTPSPHGIPMGMICYHLTRGNPEASIEWFEKAVQLRETLVLVYVSDPRVQTIRSSARWDALMQVMNLSEAAA